MRDTPFIVEHALPIFAIGAVWLIGAGLFFFVLVREPELRSGTMAERVAWALYFALATVLWPIMLFMATITALIGRGRHP